MIDKVKAALASIWADTVDTYKKIKIYLLGILAIIAVIEWRKIKEALTVYAGQKEIKDDQKKDQNLAQKENAANEEADALVKKAKELPSEEKPVGDDWNTK